MNARSFSLVSSFAAALAGCAMQPPRAVPPLAGFAPPAAAHPNATRRVLFHVFDTRGNRIAWSAFRELEEAGQGSNGANDALLDPTTLVVTRTGPLFSSGGDDGDPSLTLPTRGRSALSLAWPGSDGYSNLIFALPSSGGAYDFNELAARGVLDDIHASLIARSWYTPSTQFARLYAKASDEYARALRAKPASQAGALAARALDAGTSAETELLAEAGVAYMQTHSGAKDWGATFDTITGGTAGLKVAARLYPKNGWLRIVFDPGEKPAYYAAEIAHAHALGLSVVGQILDSSEMRRWSVARFEARTREYVGALPDVDEWETGNEISGDWLGSTSSVVAKTLYASKYVKTHTHARVMVTLYWELGEGRAANAIFNWAHAHMTSIVPYVDDIGISLYPRQNPMGEPFDRAIAALHAEFPSQRIAITELDYDSGRGWWWGSENSISHGREAVAALYQAAIMGYAYSGGGTFWWYFVEEVSPGNALYRTLNSVYRSAQRGSP